MAHPNVELVEKGYGAFGRGDLDTVREVFAPDIAWHITGRNPLARTYHGVDDVFSFFGEISERTGGTFKLEPHATLGDGEHVVALLHMTAQVGAKSIDQDVVHVWHVREGRAVEFWGHVGDQYAFDDALS